MSEYVHEVVLQEYICEKISGMNLSVKYKTYEQYKIISAKINSKNTFWDLEGKLENGIWIPIEVEWISSNFLSHRHHKSKDFEKFNKLNGVLLTLRKSSEIEGIQQIAILDSLPEKQFKDDFKRWFKTKSNEYIDKTLDNYLTGNYYRKTPRILLYPLSKDADKNYFSSGTIYKKDISNPCLLGFKDAGFNRNVFIRDIQPNDICVFLFNNGVKMPRNKFIQECKKKNVIIHRLAVYRIKSKLIDRRKNMNFIDENYWPDEIRDNVLRYPYVCTIQDEPFLMKNNLIFPYNDLFSQTTWESFRSCMLHKEYREISSLDFTIFISSL